MPLPGRACVLLPNTSIWTFLVVLLGRGLGDRLHMPRAKPTLKNIFSIPLHCFCRLRPVICIPEPFWVINGVLREVGFPF